MTTIRRGYVDLESGQIHYRRSGDHGPVIVLFHESPLSSQIFERALPLLGERATAIAFDTPGYGSSDPPRSSIEIPDYAAMLLMAINELSIERFAVGGVHTGASIAIEIASQAGYQRVTHSILSGVPLFTEQEREDFLASWAPDVKADGEGTHLRWAWERYLRIWGADSPPDLLNLGAVHIAGNLNGYNSAYNAAFRYDPGPALSRMKCPLYLLNCEHDLIVYTDARAMQLVPGATLKHVPGLRGQLPWRMPKLYANEVIDFISTATNAT